MNPDGDSRPTAELTEGPGDAEPPSWLAVDLQIDDDGWLALDHIDRAVQHAAAALARNVQAEERRPGSALASIALAADADVAALNREFRGQDKPTNVLSFPSAGQSPAPRAAVRYLGDIILARETVFAEAAANGVAALDHVSHLVVHGLLHLLGYDHETDAQAETMEMLEIANMATLGIGNPYPDRPAAMLPLHRTTKS